MLTNFSKGTLLELTTDTTLEDKAKIHFFPVKLDVLGK